MKNLKKVILSSILFISLCFISSFCNAAETKVVGNEGDLINAISQATNGDVIELSASISLTKPIETTGKTLTINGKGNSISRLVESWEQSGNNGTLISVGAGGKLELKNLTLTNSQKYGAQAYNGGHLVLNGVTISNCGYGGVLANAGTVEVKDLTLQRNGSPNNNGIEIAKGDTTDEDNVPVVVMNGTLSSTEKENVIYVAKDNPNLKTFEVKNAEDTIDKILISDNKIVITDEDNKILYQSAEITNATVKGDDYVETKPETKPENKKDTTPKTGIEISLVFAVLTIAFSMLCIASLKRNEIKD